MKDKALKVQTAAGEAMKEWQKLKKQYEESEKQKMTEKSKTNNLLNKYRDARKLARQADTSPIPEDQIPATWGSAARAAKFLRKKDGLGGDKPVRKTAYKAQPKSEELDNDFVLREIAAEEKCEEPRVEEKCRKEASDIDIEESSGSVYDTELAKCSYIHPPQVFHKEIKPLTDIISNEVTLKSPVVFPQVDEQNTYMEGRQIYDNSKEEATIKAEPKPPKLPHRVSEQWADANEKLKAGNIEEGYKAILSTEDDLYLLSAMQSTGPISLPTDTGESVIKRANQIVRANTVPKLVFKLIQEALNNGNFHRYNRKLQNELLDTLHGLSETKSEIAEEAKKMYEQILRQNSAGA
eukprot:TRINITY_DN2104_c0_g2_i1.p1 TRINITY_DN2104_c0_g2~~TRINITY_DN2104_c0_g2_i1.p1  ORF type:complete len:352 (+),score=53.94 TRINITY_DN2104_c0_g2_i1:93-1148(+)